MFTKRLLGLFLAKNLLITLRFLGEGAKIASRQVINSSEVVKNLIYELLQNEREFHIDFSGRGAARAY